MFMLYFHCYYGGSVLSVLNLTLDVERKKCQSMRHVGINSSVFKRLGAEVFNVVLFCDTFQNRRIAIKQS